MKFVYTPTHNWEPTAKRTFGFPGRTSRSPRKGNRLSIVSANACQMHSSCETGRRGCCGADARTSSSHAGREAGSDFAFSVFLAVSGTSHILTILQTATGHATALLSTKAGSMCLKRHLQNSAPFKTLLSETSSIHLLWPKSTLPGHS